MQFTAPSPFAPITPLRSFSPSSSHSAADQHQTHTHTQTVLPVTLPNETHAVTPTRYSSVAIMTTLWATRSQVWIPSAARIFLHSKLSRPAQFNGYRGSFPGVKRQERYFDSKNGWSYTSTPPHMPWWRGQAQLYLVLFSTWRFICPPSAHHVTNIKPNSLFSSVLKGGVYNRVYLNELFVKIACKYWKLSTRRDIPFCGSASTVDC